MKNGGGRAGGVSPLVGHLLFVAICGSLLAVPAFAHGPKRDAHAQSSTPAGPQNWDELWTAWPFEPFVLVPLLLSLWLYLRGVRRLGPPAGVGRGVGKWEAASFLGGWAALVVALESPLHPWGNVLFSA